MTQRRSSDATDSAGRARALLLESARVKTAAAELLGEEVARAAGWVSEVFRRGSRVLLFGNGGSAADALHLAAEWTGRLRDERRALPALALGANGAEITALGNDYGFERLYARLVEAHGRQGDLAVAISTSGRSPNVLAAVDVARRLGLRTIGLLGKGGGDLAARVELPIVVPSDDTQRIQECHIAIGHTIAELVDARLAEGARR